MTAKQKNTQRKPDLTNGKCYTPQELADLLGITVGLLTYLRISGRGPKYIKFSCRTIRYSATEIDRYLKQQERRSTSDPGPNTNDL